MANYIDQFTRPVPVRPADTALVVIDMQHASGSRERGLGRYLAERGRLQEAEYRFNRIEQLIIPNTQRLLAAWRASKAPVIYVKVGAFKPDLSDAPPHLRAFFQITNNYEGSPDNQIVEALAPQPGTSRRAPGHKVYPYLLRKLAIERSNQVWALDMMADDNYLGRLTTTM